MSGSQSLFPLPVQDVLSLWFSSFINLVFGKSHFISFNGVFKEYLLIVVGQDNICQWGTSIGGFSLAATYN